MRPEKLYLLDIIEAAGAISRFCEHIDEDQFLTDELRQSAVLQKLIVIGEATARLPGDFRLMHKEIEWEDIVGYPISLSTNILLYFGKSCGTQPFKMCLTYA